MKKNTPNFDPFTIIEDKVADNLPMNPQMANFSKLFFDRTKRSGTYTLSSGHYHNMYEIYFLLEGQCRYFIENRIYDVIAGDLVLIPKRSIHKTLYDDIPTERYVINFSKNYIPPSLSIPVHELFKNNIYRPTPENRRAITKIFTKIDSEYRLADEYSRLAIYGCLTELYTLILRNPMTDVPDSSEKGNIPIENVTQYITKHFQEPLTLEQMAVMASLSTSYFSRLFKNITGFGFKEYLTIIRIKEAQRKLAHTDVSICQIAYDCGFNDSNYFSSVFKQQNGISPLRYRTQNRIKSENFKKRMQEDFL